MDVVKKAAGHMRAVMKRMIFIGFSIQIIWGLVWMGCNFGRIQDFGEPEGKLYGRLFWLLGGIPQLMYLLQMLAAFFTGYFLLQKLRPHRRLLAVWRGLVLLTVPFAMQCHLALQPYSLLGSLFLLLLLALLAVCKELNKSVGLNCGSDEAVPKESFRNKGGKAVRNLALAAVCIGGMILLSGVGDRDRRQEPGYSFQGAMASRFAWPTLWNDLVRYPQELREMTEEIAWEASLAPGNMKLFYETVESQVGAERARSYYLQMAKAAWEYHAPMVIRQIGWDVLGYAVSPLIFLRQMAGEAYASCSGRNYEIMRSRAPVVTRNYVDYGCWWFGCAVILAALSAAAGLFEEDGKSRGGASGLGSKESGNGVGNRDGKEGGAAGQKSGQEENEGNRGGANQGSSQGDMVTWEIYGKRLAAFSGICICMSGILITLLVMRGAGQMDYRAAIAINELWLCWPLSALGRGRQERK